MECPLWVHSLIYTPHRCQTECGIMLWYTKQYYKEVLLYVYGAGTRRPRFLPISINKFQSCKKYFHRELCMETKRNFTDVTGKPVQKCDVHYTDVTMSPMASQITSLGNVYSTVYSGSDQRKHQSYPSLAFVRRIHRGPVNSPQKWPVTRKMFSFDDVIMDLKHCIVCIAHVLTQLLLVYCVVYLPCALAWSRYIEPEQL